MKLRQVDPRVIKVPEMRVTAQFEPELLEQLRQSLRDAGQVAPLIVFEVDGELVLVDGKHRLDAALNDGDRTVDVVVQEGDMVDVLCRNVFLDHVRGKHPASEMVRVIGALYEVHHVDIEELQKRTGLTRDYIERLLRISTASPAVQEALDQGIIGVGHAFEVSRLPHPIQQEEVIAKGQVYRLKVKDVKDIVDNVLREMQDLAEQPPPARPGEPPPPPVYHCEGCKNEIEQRYLRPVLVCPDCFGHVWRLARETEAPAAPAGDEGEGG